MNRFRVMTAMVVALVLATATLLLPTAATADDGRRPDFTASVDEDFVAPPVPACDRAPETDGATPENRARFLDLWLPRVKDKAFIERFAAARQVPAEIRAEGLHELPARTTLWLAGCLVDRVAADRGSDLAASDRDRAATAMHLLIFGKEQINEIRDDIAGDDAPPQQLPESSGVDPYADRLDVVEDLGRQPGLSSSDHARAELDLPVPRTTDPIAGVRNQALPNLLRLPPLPQLLDAVHELEQTVAGVQRRLFTLPVLNLLAGAFYKICAESPTMPLSCSVSLPVGVPVPADVDGDRFPDVLGLMLPVTNVRDAGVRFQVTRLANYTGPLKAHVFAVYDTPIGRKRLTAGFDGRASTLGLNSSAQVVIRNVVDALAGDVRVDADVRNNNPGDTEALTFGVKSLVGSAKTEADPLSASVQMNPFPATFEARARLTHSATGDRDTVTIEPDRPVEVDAVIDQATTTTSPRSSRRFTAALDDLPESLTVDLIRNPNKSTVQYLASDEVGSAIVGDIATPDTSRPGTYTESVYQARQVPDQVQVELTGGEDVRYAASAEVPMVGFHTRSFTDGALDYRINGEANGIPTSLHAYKSGNKLGYETNGTVDRVAADIGLASGDTLVAEVTELPTRADVVFDGAGSKLDWKSAEPVGSLTAAAHLTAGTVGGTRPFEAALALEDIPTRWDASWAEGNVQFHAPDGIGATSVQVTNHGSVHRAAGQHLSAFYDAPSGDLDASVDVSGLRQVGLNRLAGEAGGGFDATLDVGDHEPLNLLVDLALAGGDKVRAAGRFTAMPGPLRLISNDGRINYTGEGSTDLSLSVQAGEEAILQLTPEAPAVHGLSYRDGFLGDKTATKARLYLTGLPSSVDFNPSARLYKVGGFHPSEPVLVLDVVMGRGTPDVLELQAEQTVPTDGPVDFEFGPYRINEGRVGTTDFVNLDYRASRELGGLIAHLRQADLEATTTLSSIPTSVALDAVLGLLDKRITLAMGQGIEKVTLQAKGVDSGFVGANVQLTDVPASTDIHMVKAGGTDAEGDEASATTFEAVSSQPGLDVVASIAGDIEDSDSNLEGSVTVVADNLGHTVTGAMDGTKVKLASEPATDLLRITGEGSFDVEKDLDFDIDIPLFAIDNEGRVDAHVTVNELLVGFTDLVNAELDLGFTSGLKGDYGQFMLQTDVDANVHVRDNIDFEIRWHDVGDIGLPTVEIPIAGIHDSFELNDLIQGWHVAENKLQSLHGWTVRIPIIDADCSVRLFAKPGQGRLGPRPFLRIGSSEDGWVITPNVNLFGFNLDEWMLSIVAMIATPYDRDFDVDADC